MDRESRENHQQSLDTLSLSPQGIGYAICFTDMYMAMYYNTIIAWAVYYLMASFTWDEVPWMRCNNSWNTAACMTLFERSSNSNATNATSPSQEYFE